jgi:hypothetical protein
MAVSLPALVLASLVGASAGRAEARQDVPVLVELFTSEGCSSCPPADVLLAHLVRDQPVPGARVIALGEHVDVWDDLGWKDTFSSPLFTHRQEDYVRSLGLAGAYTPQLVIGGRLQAVGSDESAARSAIGAVARSSTSSGRIRVQLLDGSGGEPSLDVHATWSGGVAEVVVAVVEDRALTRVSRGENAGRTLAHVSAARSLVTVATARGEFSGRVALERAGVAGPAHAIVFLQAPGGGPVYAANTVALPSAPSSSTGSRGEAPRP